MSRSTIRFVVTCAALAVALQSLPAAAAVDGWSYSGPSGAPIFRLEISGPAAPWYAVSVDGVYRSRSQGQAWRHVLAGSGSLRDARLQVDPSRPEIVVAGLVDGFFVSEDAGESWRGPLKAADGAVLDDVVIHPAEPTTWYALDRVPFRFGGGLAAADRVRARDVYFPPTSRVLRSRDLGRHWEEVKDYLISQWLVPDTSDPEVLMAFQLNQVARSTDGGRSWVASDDWYGVSEENDPAVRRVSPSPREGMLFVTGLGTLGWTGDGGATWGRAVVHTSAGQYLPIRDALVDPADPESLLVATSEGPYSTSIEELLTTPIDEVTWRPLDVAPAGSYFDLAAEPGTAEGVVAAGLEGLSVRSANAGWQPRPGSGLQGVRSSAVALVSQPAPRVAQAGEAGLHRSADGGASWSRDDEAPAAIRSLATSAGSQLYALAGDGLFAQLPGSSGWELRSEGKGQALIGHPSEPDTVFRLISGRFQRSRDGGRSWIDLFGDDPRVLSAAVAAGDPQQIYVGTERGLWHSHNGGASFGPESLPVDLAVAAVAADPADAEHAVAVATPAPFSEQELTQIVERDPASGSWKVRVTTSGGHECDTAQVVFRPQASGRASARVCGALRDRGADGKWGPAEDLPPFVRVSDVVLAADLSDPWRLWAATDRGLFSRLDVGAEPLMLRDGRFEVRAAWEGFHGGRGSGRPVPLTGDTGAFWFFDPANVELVVKVLDGRPVNGRYWVFYGSLTNVSFVLTVRDLESGESVTYRNPSGTFASRGDTEALPPSVPVAGAASGPAGSVGASEARSAPQAVPHRTAAAETEGQPLLLRDGRFAVRVEWEDFRGNSGNGTPQAITGDTGYFWFFRPDNVELVVKVLDGRPVNGRWWVFAGALSNVAYRLTVTDTVSDETVVYDNPSGTFASFGDTAAFPRP